MPRTLYGKLAAVLIAVFSGVGLLYALLSVSGVHNSQERIAQRLNRDLARNLVADRNLVTAGAIDQTALKQTFDMYMAINPSIEIYLLDREGTIISYSADPKRVKRRQVSLEPIKAFLRGDLATLVLGDDPRDHAGRKAFSATPIPSPENPEGYLYVVLQSEQLEAVANPLYQRYFLHLGLGSVLLSLALGLAVSLFVFRVLTRRLHRLADHMDTFDATGRLGHLPARAEDNGDEIDRLSITFERMAGHLLEQLEALRHNDALRRQLVAHVSHDLRTPLASMRGYLESLKMRWGALSASEREDYLGIALANAEQLSTLVNQLFELASLDARDVAPRLETFAPAELVQDVLQKFGLRAQALKVNLDMAQPPGLPTVEADIGLTERVLENLIENALRHTPPGGQIVVSLTAEGPQVAIEVADTGPGIGEGDINTIFEPFQRAADSPGPGGFARTEPGSSGPAHAGLGLAIARRIVELHGGRLTVDSQLGAGARFRFTFPAAAQGR